MPRPARHRLLPLLALALGAGLAGAPALATQDPDDPPPLTPIRDPAPVEPVPPQIVLAWATSPRPPAGATPRSAPAHPAPPSAACPQACVPGPPAP